MSHTLSRIDPRAGRVADPSTLPRGPHGRALCRFCTTEVPKGRRTFCSAPCLHEWQVRTSPSYARHHVGLRDGGRCAICHVCTESQRRALAAVPMRKRRQWLAERLIPWHRRFGQWWDADHIRPVAAGGGACGLDNLQTLCLACHRAKTAAQLALRRKDAARCPASAPAIPA